MSFRTVVYGLLLAGVSGLAAACSDLFGPEVPDGTHLLSPLPEEYEGWWTIIERCSGLAADMSEVRFRVLPGHETWPGHDAAGAYYKRGHQIVLVEESARDGFLVRHEMLHAVLARNGRGGPPKPFFEGHCGGAVSCGVPCADEVGGVPGEAHVTPLLEPDDVLVAVEVVPSVVGSPPEERGCTTIVVEAQNVGSQAAVVTLNRPTDFGWIVDGWGKRLWAHPSKRFCWRPVLHDRMRTTARHSCRRSCRESIGSLGSGTAYGASPCVSS